MPIGKPTGQTSATERWQKKAGLIQYQTRVKKELADEFRKVCEKNNIPQTKAISDFMENFIKKYK